jgi:hypothetical protein
LTYDGAVYERDSSLATIAGNFETLDPNSGTMIMLNINTDGTIFVQVPSTGCVLNGAVELIDSRFNAYRFEAT